MGGVELNPGPAKTIEDLDIKLNKITGILWSHASETKTRLDDFDTKWTGLKKRSGNHETRHSQIKGKHTRLDKNNRKHNLIVYGLYEDINERKWDLIYKLLDLFNK